MSRSTGWRSLRRLLLLLLLSGLALQIVFALRVLWMKGVDPESTPFQRSEIWRLLREKHRVDWSQQTVSSRLISIQLKRAVIASEDAGFVEHGGVDWDSLKQAWRKNQRAEQTAQRRDERLRPGQRPVQAKIVGGSTISQQLAKNLFLSGERSVLRKAQELVLTLMLESMLSKERILDLYLNNVEWGEGVFGAEAAAHHYFRLSAAQLGTTQAARLAVMLPAPKRFEKQPGSAYVLARSATIAARMPAVEIP
jgi:monofunctional biosynthetic peptidoglycan transglycosylase